MSEKIKITRDKPDTKDKRFYEELTKKVLDMNKLIKDDGFFKVEIIPNDEGVLTLHFTDKRKKGLEIVLQTPEEIDDFLDKYNQFKKYYPQLNKYKKSFLKFLTVDDYKNKYLPQNDVLVNLSRRKMLWNKVISYHTLFSLMYNIGVIVFFLILLL